MVLCNFADKACRGMNTVYIQRSTEDLDEHTNEIRNDVDLFIDGLNANSGLVELARKMGC